MLKAWEKDPSSKINHNSHGYILKSRSRSGISFRYTLRATFNNADDVDEL